MSKERNNVAILGTGHIAAKMAATLQQMKDVNCYAVASREQIRAKPQNHCRYASHCRSINKSRC